MAGDGASCVHVAQVVARGPDQIIAVKAQLADEVAGLEDPGSDDPRRSGRSQNRRADRADSG